MSPTIQLRVKDERLFQWRRLVAEQQGGEHLPIGHCRRFEHVADNPAESKEGTGGEIFIGADGIVLFDASRLVPTRLARSCNTHISPLEFIEHRRKETQMLGSRDVSINEEQSIAGMIQFAVKMQELRIGQVRNALRVATRIFPERCVRKETAFGQFTHQLLRRGRRALHFAVDDAGHL